MNQVFPHGQKEEDCKNAQDLKMALCLARALLSSRRPADALTLVDRMVARFPSHTGLLYLRGQALQATNSGPAAFATFMSVLSIDSEHVPSMCSVGEIYKLKGMLQESAAAYSRAREVDPDNAVARSALAAVLTDLGTKAKCAGALQEGMDFYQRAIEQYAGYAPAYYNMGVLNSEAKQFDAALEWYHKATQLHPMYAEAHCNVGVILKERGDLDGAISAYNRALAAAPNFTIVHGNLAIALTDLGTRAKMEGKIQEGIALYERALAHNSKYADALYNLGVAHGALGQYEKAIFMYETAIQHNPKCAEAYNNLGVIFKERDNLERAMECYSAALTVKPDFPQSLNNMGVIFTAQGRAQEALTLLTAAIVSSPTYAEAHNNLGVLQRDVGAISEALASYSRCLELVPDSRNAGQNRLLALNYIHCGSEPLVCQAHADWGTRFQKLFSPMPPLSPSEQDLDPERTLRIGYVSPDLFTHSVSYFAEVPLSKHRTPSKHGAEGKVQHITYCCTPKQDAKTARLKAGVEEAGGLWREVTKLSESDLAKLIREDKVDILVELTGHTANNRLGTMAMRPAPIQASWIGYANSTGLEAVDYRLTDEKCDPSNTQQTFVEELVRLPGCFLCYTPAALDQPPVAPLPALNNRFITFGSFNNLAKITPEVLKLWARILLAVPNSRLMLKNKPFACETARNHFLNLLLAEGVETWRVDLVPLAASNTEHMAMYSHLDISLDPFPYAGTTTTCESLFMGVPCISLAGECHACNVGVSLLAALDLEKDWVAHSQDEYVALAVKHAGQLSRLSALRDRLRPHMLASPLCDAAPFIARLEDLYRQLWRRYIVEGREGMDRQRHEHSQSQRQQLQRRQQQMDKPRQLGELQQRIARVVGEPEVSCIHMAVDGPEATASVVGTAAATENSRQGESSSAEGGTQADQHQVGGQRGGDITVKQAGSQGAAFGTLSSSHKVNSASSNSRSNKANSTGEDSGGGCITLDGDTNGLASSGKHSGIMGAVERGRLQEEEEKEAVTARCRSLLLDPKEGQPEQESLGCQQEQLQEAGQQRHKMARQ